MNKGYSSNNKTFNNQLQHDQYFNNILQQEITTRNAQKNYPEEYNKYRLPDCITKYANYQLKQIESPRTRYTNRQLCPNNIQNNRQKQKNLQILNKINSNNYQQQTPIENQYFQRKYLEIKRKYELILLENSQLIIKLQDQNRKINQLYIRMQLLNKCTQRYNIITQQNKIKDNQYQNKVQKLQNLFNQLIASNLQKQSNKRQNLSLKKQNEQLKQQLQKLNNKINSIISFSSYNKLSPLSPSNKIQLQGLSYRFNSQQQIEPKNRINQNRQRQLKLVIQVKTPNKLEQQERKCKEDFSLLKEQIKQIRNLARINNNTDIQKMSIEGYKSLSNLNHNNLTNQKTNLKRFNAQRYKFNHSIYQKTQTKQQKNKSQWKKIQSKILELRNENKLLKNHLYN